MASPLNLYLFVFLYLFLSSFIAIINSLNTVSISRTSNQTLICALQNSDQQQEGQARLNCTSFPPGIQLQVNNPNNPFSEIAGGNGFLCALTTPSSSSSTSVMFCWRFFPNATNVLPKRVYRGPMIQDLNAGNSHVCGLSSANNGLNCWQWPEFNGNIVRNFTSIAVGENFVCGLLQNRGINCTGSQTQSQSQSTIVGQQPSGNYSEVAAATSHACAISYNGSLACWGNVPAGSTATSQGSFISMALGENGGCAVRAVDRKVECWGTDNFSLPENLRGESFEAIAAKGSVFCGVKSDDFSLHCWGDGNLGPNSTTKVFDKVLPGTCRKSSLCSCGPLQNSAQFCNQGSVICKPCEPLPEIPSPTPPLSPSSQPAADSGWSNKMVAFLVVGSVGSVSLLLVSVFFLYNYCRGRGCRRVHDSGPLDERRTERNQPEVPQTQTADPVLEKRLSHVISMGSGGHLEEFSLQLLVKATDNFSEDHKIGSGSFGSVYRATLEDGREVAVKRAEISPTSALGTTKRQQDRDKDNAFVNELESLSRLNHKNLVRLLGFFEDSNERILVYEFMNNGSLNDHLHELDDNSSSSPLMSWEGRIKVALDAARGLEYLHEYAIPPIIHRDIKSANILLDAKWTAKVSDFGLSLMGPDPEDEDSHLSLLAAGTVGYMDPEYYRLQHLTTKSDVYSFGVVLLELLCGYKAIHRNENGMPRNVVDFVVPYIVQDEIHRVLDKRVPPPTPYEIEAVAFVGYLAADCVRLEGRDRPSMTRVVDSLERALAACLVQPALSWSTPNSPQ